MPEPVDPDPYGRTLSVIVPVFDERNTVVEVLRRMRRVELPGEPRDRRRRRRLHRRHVADPRRPRGLHRPGRPPSHEPGQGRGHPHRPPARPRRAGADPGRRPGVRPRGLAPPAAPDPAGPGRGRLRQPVQRRGRQHGGLRVGRQPVPVAGHQPPVQHQPVRHGVRLQAVRPQGARRHHHRVRPVRLRAGDHGQGAAARATASTRCRCRTRAGRPARAGSSTGATACGPCPRWSATGWGKLR